MFKPGDVVEQIGVGIPMTVEKVLDDPGNPPQIECVWFEGDILHRDSFEASRLTESEAEEEEPDIIQSEWDPEDIGYLRELLQSREQREEHIPLGVRCLLAWLRSGLEGECLLLVRKEAE